MSTRAKLAKKLQASFPEHNGLALIWDEDHIWPAQGAYRSRGIDCARWSAAAYHVRADGTPFTVFMVDSYYTITELVRAKKLAMSKITGEIYPADVDIVLPA